LEHLKIPTMARGRELSRFNKPRSLNRFLLRGSQIAQFHKDPKKMEFPAPAESLESPPICADGDGDFWD
jgi:hypothetical protein